MRYEQRELQVEEAHTVSCAGAGALQQPGGGEELIQISLLINFLCISL